MDVSFFHHVFPPFLSFFLCPKKKKKNSAPKNFTVNVGALSQKPQGVMVSWCLIRAPPFPV